ncbi:MAG: hypothetical protein RhofKO_33470 [Rhodothermales bacterium]
MRRESFDPAPLIDLLKQQYPESETVAEALTQCTSGYRESRAYMYFVMPNDPAWGGGETLMLVDSKRGEIVLDVLVDGRIGGIEWVYRL